LSGSILFFNISYRGHPVAGSRRREKKVSANQSAYRYQILISHPVYPGRISTLRSDRETTHFMDWTNFLSSREPISFLIHFRAEIRSGNRQRSNCPV